MMFVGEVLLSFGFWGVGSGYLVCDPFLLNF